MNASLSSKVWRARTRKYFSRTAIQCGVVKDFVLHSRTGGFTRLLKRAWSNQGTGAEPRDGRLEFAFECETRFMANSPASLARDNSNEYAKHSPICPLPDCFHFTFSRAGTFFHACWDENKRTKANFKRNCEWCSWVVVDTFGALWFLLTF